MNVSSWKENKAVIILAAAVIFIAGVQYSKYTMHNNEIKLQDNSSNENTPVTVSASSAAEKKNIKVHVAGAVFEKGLYELKQGSRVDDAVKRAVPLPEADLDSLNLAAPLSDGQKVFVRYKNKNITKEKVPLNSAEEGSGKINLNSASLDKLQELPGIGPALAARILEYRKQNGTFKSSEDLKNVSGIGDKKYKSIKELVTAY